MNTRSFIFLSLCFISLNLKAQVAEYNLIDQNARTQVSLARQLYGTCYAHALSGLLDFALTIENTSKFSPIDPFYISLLTTLKTDRKNLLPKTDKNMRTLYNFEGANLYEIKLSLDIILGSQTAYINFNGRNREQQLHKSMKELFTKLALNTITPQDIEIMIEDFSNLIKEEAQLKIVSATDNTSVAIPHYIQNHPKYKSEEELLHERKNNMRIKLNNLFHLLMDIKSITVEKILHFIVDAFDPIQDHILIENIKSQARNFNLNENLKRPQDKLSFLIMFLYPPQYKIDLSSIGHMHSRVDLSKNFPEKYFMNLKSSSMPLYIGFCSAHSVYTNTDPEACGGHAVLAMGMRKINGKSQILLRDSNGECKINSKLKNFYSSNFVECDSNGIEGWFNYDLVKKSLWGSIILE